MKKLQQFLILVSSFAFFLSQSVYSDTILGVYAGLGAWSAEPDGSVGVAELGSEPITAQELALGKEDNTYFFVALEHPIPIIPNIRLANTELTTSGSADVNRTFVLDEQTFVAGDTQSDMDLSHTDVTLYYEILDNWVSLDLGLTGRMMDGSARIEGTVRDGFGNEAPGEESVDLDGTIPMVYTRAQFELPFSGWYLGGALNYISKSGDKFTDLDMMIGYMFENVVLDVGVEVGYRQFKVNVEDDEDLSADINFDGIHAAVMLHF